MGETLSRGQNAGGAQSGHGGAGSVLETRVFEGVIGVENRTPPGSNHTILVLSPCKFLLAVWEDTLYGGFGSCAEGEEGVGGGEEVV